MATGKIHPSARCLLRCQRKHLYSRMGRHWTNHQARKNKLIFEQGVDILVYLYSSKFKRDRQKCQYSFELIEILIIRKRSRRVSSVPFFIICDKMAPIICSNSEHSIPHARSLSIFPHNTWKLITIRQLGTPSVVNPEK